MSCLQDLIDIPLDEISDEELEELMIRGRLAREVQPTEKKARKKAEPKGRVEIDEDFD